MVERQDLVDVFAKDYRAVIEQYTHPTNKTTLLLINNLKDRKWETWIISDNIENHLKQFDSYSAAKDESIEIMKQISKVFRELGKDAEWQQVELPSL